MIENNPISSSSLTSRSADEVQLSEKKARFVEQKSVENNYDRVEVSENARILSKATVALNEENEIQDEKIQEITRQVQDGIYQIPVNKLASVLLGRLYTDQ